jgi:hypothetical protein
MRSKLLHHSNLANGAVFSFHYCRSEPSRFI